MEVEFETNFARLVSIHYSTCQTCALFMVICSRIQQVEAHNLDLI